MYDATCARVTERERHGGMGWTKCVLCIISDIWYQCTLKGVGFCWILDSDLVDDRRANEQRSSVNTQLLAGPVRTKTLNKTIATVAFPCHVTSCTSSIRLSIHMRQQFQKSPPANAAANAAANATTTKPSPLLPKR